MIDLRPRNCYGGPHFYNVLQSDHVVARVAGAICIQVHSLAVSLFLSDLVHLCTICLSNVQFRVWLLCTLMSTHLYHPHLGSPYFSYSTSRYTTYAKCTILHSPH